MASYTDSIHALRELLASNLSYSSCCSITKISQNISHLSNGIEYCLIEITCDDGIQYGIQACGDGAIQLHKEALKYYKQQPLQSGKQEGEKEKEEKKERHQVITPFVYNVSS
jgi:hypothetical protein